MITERINETDLHLSTKTLEDYVLAVPDFPKEGVLFRDMSPLLAEPEAFRELVGRLSHEIKRADTSKVVGLESRGFLFGIAVAQALGLPFVTARKAGKLPGETVSIGYALEYGEQKLELQRESIKPGERVAIIDDLLATGGTAHAAAQLIQELGGSVSGFFFAIELESLGGRARLSGATVEAVMCFA
jgi:adenine phosphoribosyltransferase